MAEDHAFRYSRAARIILSILALVTAVCAWSGVSLREILSVLTF